MEQEPQYLPISPKILFPSETREFSLYTKRGSHYRLYCYKDDPFTREHKELLLERGIARVYVRAPSRDWFKQYAQTHLGSVLQDHTIPLEERSRAFYDTSLSVVRQTFNQKLPQGLDPAVLQKIERMVKEALSFLSREETLRSLGALMSHDYDTYCHSVNVFILSASILQTFKRFNEDDLVQVGIGAILHDIGKTELPSEIINKPGKLTPEEYRLVREHPRVGQRLCAGAPLHQQSHDVILYHHEKLDGSGYPIGAHGHHIPQCVRVVTIVDIYDALTSKRPYAPPLAPFDALQLMRREFDGKIDPVYYERFVRLLSLTL